MLVQPSTTQSHVTGAIRQAAAQTGTSFGYLLATAQIESNLNPSAKAATSSAQGLFQFIDQTWLQTVKQSGAAHGLGQYAAAISRSADGQFQVADPGMRTAIMNMRSNPKINATMGAAYTRSNAEALYDGLGREATEGELYIAHFLGADGATRLIGAALSAPKVSAATLFPQAAAANRPIFYDRLGGQRSVVDVYRTLTGKFEAARANNPDTNVTATASLRGSLPANPSAPRPPAPIATEMAKPSVVPDTAGITSAYADANSRPVKDERPMFQALFTDAPRKGGVAPVVGQLWSPASAAADSAAARTLGLFTDMPPSARKLFGGT